MALVSKDAALRAGPGGRTDDGDLELNMTPMIDIVFQLIVFFMLQLKFKEIDRQIDSTLPKTEGIDTIAVTPPDSEKLKLKVFRRGLDGPPETQLTVIRVDSSHELHLPTGWSSYAEESVERRNVFDAVLAQLGVAVRGRAAASPDRSKLLAEIVAPPPSGGYVPHGDVMRILDVLLQAGFHDVRFEGALSPLAGGAMR
ncbi:MAG: biopolymer transporter ExbD [Planctomycetes bacterium]|nr:biopolymer transporter ExbD [Planctomycetota bacterium]MCB9830539.1 biopolymer transporter ExbD [Planctomycetota bacterium]MCB9901317.1 biopolymer transporter ExbD [Planctomycetota bacterium]